MLNKILRLFFLSILVVSCQTGGPKKRVNLYIWTYYIPDHILTLFTEETGIQVVYDTYDSNETMYAKMATGNAGFDVTVPSGDFVSIMIEQDMLAPIQHDQIPNFLKIDPKILDLNYFDRGNRYSIPYFVGASGLNINTKEVPDYVSTWGIFNDAALKNRMTMLNDMREAMGAALKFLGYSVNSRKEKELLQAQQVLMDWKKNLLKFDAETFGKDFASENIYVAQGYPEVVVKELDPKEREHYRFVLPKEGGPMYIDSFVILKDSKNIPEAQTLINFILRPDIYAQIADEFYYPSLIPEATALQKEKPFYQVDELIAKGFEFKNDLGKDISRYNQLWEEVLQN